MKSTPNNSNLETITIESLLGPEVMDMPQASLPLANEDDNLLKIISNQDENQLKAISFQDLCSATTAMGLKNQTYDFVWDNMTCQFNVAYLKALELGQDMSMVALLYTMMEHIRHDMMNVRQGVYYTLNEMVQAKQKDQQQPSTDFIGQIIQPADKVGRAAQAVKKGHTSKQQTQCPTAQAAKVAQVAHRAAQKNARTAKSSRALGMGMFYGERNGKKFMRPATKADIRQFKAAEATIEAAQKKDRIAKVDAMKEAVNEAMEKSKPAKKQRLETLV
jgi:hypothetical protein